MLSKIRPDSNPSHPGLEARRGLFSLGLAALVLLILVPALMQGLNWDEFWLMGQARLLGARGGTDAYKPMAGLLGLPYLGLDQPWMALRLQWVVIQGGIAGCLWALMPGEWGRTRKVGLLLLLWLEPTFRERVLEIRTDGVVLLMILLATGVWHSRPRAVWRVALPLAMALVLTPKSILWVVPWFPLAWILHPREGTSRRLIQVGLATALLALLGWLSAAAVTHRGLLELMAEGGRQSGEALRGRGAFFERPSWFYFFQLLRQGAFYYALLGVGLVRWVRRGAGELRATGPWGHLGALGLTLFALSPFYDGAFPYQYVGVVPLLLPLVADGCGVIFDRWGRKAIPVVGLAAGAMSLWAAGPLLGGPTLQGQVELLRFALGFVPQGGSYFDGVGGIAVKHAGPFLTDKVVRRPENQDLVDRWKREHLGVVIVNGRVELSFFGANQRWLEGNFIMVHPNVLVLGTAATTSQGPSLDHAWMAPWAAEFEFHGAETWKWTVNGVPIQNEDRVHLPAGAVRIQGWGSGPATFAMFLAHPRAASIPDPIKPYFLRFDRRMGAE